MLFYRFLPLSVVIPPQPAKKSYIALAPRVSSTENNSWHWSIVSLWVERVSVFC